MTYDQMSDKELIAKVIECLGYDYDTLANELAKRFNQKCEELAKMREERERGALERGMKLEGAERQVEFQKGTIASLRSELAKVREERDNWMARFHDRLAELTQAKAEIERLKETPHKCPVCEGTGTLQITMGTAINIQPCHACKNGIVWSERLKEGKQ